MSLLSGILFLTACGQTLPVTQTALVPAVDKATTTSSPIPTNTSTPVPTETPTATITPLPTIPTFTPTFDTSTITTITPAPKAECPKENRSLKPDFQLEYYSNDADRKIPEFLNKGGAISIMVNEMSKVYNEYAYRFTDVTNDQTPELIFDGFEKLYDTFYILRCQHGQYVVFSGQDAMGVSLGNAIYTIIDMNKNGMPEIVIYKESGTGGGDYHFFIGEWNGKTFVNLAPELYLGAVDESKIEIRDINNDGTLELRLIGGSYDYEIPWRQSIHTYIWDGNTFAEQPIEYVQPVYRFQAIQDADAAVLLGKYDRAIQLYQEAISNQNLEWWSLERQKYEQAVVDARLTGPTPSIKPLEDKNEYPRLAAYAYYRIMLLKIEGYELGADTIYIALQKKFANDQYGYPYVEMATAFLNGYKSTYKIYDGCAAAIQYAAEHPEILVPLGDWYHGAQSHIYVPADVCPFR